MPNPTVDAPRVHERFLQVRAPLVYYFMSKVSMTVEDFARQREAVNVVHHFIRELQKAATESVKAQFRPHAQEGMTQVQE